LLDVSVIQRLGWNAQTDLEDGLLKTYNRFIRGVQHRS